ncbi:glycogen synthase GlgA [Corallincola platygyrae]
MTPEYEGLVKVGGLSDFSAAFTQQMRKEGQDVRVVMPYYGKLQGTLKIERSIPLEVQLSCWQSFHCLAHEVAYKGVLLYLIEYQALYGREGIYDDASGAYGDNPLRFALLSHAAFDLAIALAWQPDILHCSDWQGALVPFYRREHFAHEPLFARTRTVLTIHNGAYQGRFDGGWHQALGIHPKFMVPQLFEDMGCINLLKVGVSLADSIVTVSPSYRDELMTNERGHGLAPVFCQRRDDFSGVLNGVDLSEWDPSKDSALPANYSKGDMSGKRLCKQALLERLGWSTDHDLPLFCSIGRVAQQKGFSLMLPAIEPLLASGILRCVVMGHGEPDYVEQLNRLAAMYPQHFCYLSDFSRDGTHSVMAASDYLLMPSLFEPCGLSQLYAMRFGTVPVVHAVGGLKDSIAGLDSITSNRAWATGYQFSEADSDVLKELLALVVHHYHYDEMLLQLLRRNGMSIDLDWQRVVDAYLKLYQSLCIAVHQAGPMQPLKLA